MSQFIFDSYIFDRESREISFLYSIIHEGKTYHLKELLILPDRAYVEYEVELLKQILQAVHIALGMSYWKVFTPADIQFASYTLTEKQATYWNTVYTKGLGEFFFRNQIDFRNLVSFPSDPKINTSQSPRTSHNKLLVGVGGGKDSAVSVELLKKDNRDIEGFVVETGKSYDIIDEMIQTSQIPSLRVRRMLDPQLIELNTYPDAHNGHVPISSIYAWIALLASILYGFDGYIASNERSANIGNVSYLGMEINHQWSKSLEFEMMTREYLEDMSAPSLKYISLLRPLTEYEIVEKFVQFPQYFSIFSSCNRNFSQSKNAPSKWCGECPKCAFVFSLLSAVLSEKEVLSIFGGNLLDKPSLEKTYRELVGIEGYKPFECVGTPEEMKYALLNVHKKGSFTDSLIMNLFVKQILPTLNAADIEKDIRSHDLSSLPQEFHHLL